MLIDCPQCGKWVFTNSEKCTNCGCPRDAWIPEHAKLPAPAENERSFVMGAWGGEPIEWRVLGVGDDHLFAISVCGLDCVKFNEDRSKGNDWETSDLKAWLEQTFLPQAFFADERERNIAIAIWGSISVISVALGPIIGGALLASFWWGSVFLINVPIVLLLTPIWSRLQRKFGWFNTLAMGMSIYSLHYVGLALVSKATLWLYPVTMIIAFFFAIGINLSFTGIPYVNMPKENQTAFIGFYSTAANLAALIGVTIGRYFVEFTETWKINIFGFEMVNKQILVLITGVLIALAAVGVYWIRRSLPSEDN